MAEPVPRCCRDLPQVQHAGVHASFSRNRKLQMCCSFLSIRHTIMNPGCSLSVKTILLSSISNSGQTAERFQLGQLLFWQPLQLLNTISDFVRALPEVRACYRTSSKAPYGGPAVMLEIDLELAGTAEVWGFFIFLFLFFKMLLLCTFDARRGTDSRKVSSCPVG